MPYQCRVLLAEDNPVNQDVGRAMLETFGCRVDVADNGLEAVRLVGSNSYDIVFMDCQMPQMDGWEAALTIRIQEAERGSPRRTPIIALTAYALDEERDRCRSSGMDDYLGKPFGLRELSEVLHRWIQFDQDGNVPDEGPAAIPSPPPQTGPDTAKSAHSRPEDSPVPCLDSKALDNLKSAFGPNYSRMLAAVVNLYLSNSPSLLSELQKGLQANDPESIGRAAHTLKSSSANLGAKMLAGFCREVEEISHQGHTRGVEALIVRIEAEYKRVEASLLVMLKTEN